MPATCDGCGARIRWVITEAGKRMPLNPDPAPDGNVVPHTAGGRILARVLTGGQLPAQEPAWVPHHRTCPAAAEYRARNKRTAPRCRACLNPMDADLARLEQWTTHPCCDPQAGAATVRAALNREAS